MFLDSFEYFLVSVLWLGTPGMQIPDTFVTYWMNRPIIDYKPLVHAHSNLFIRNQWVQFKKDCRRTCTFPISAYIGIMLSDNGREIELWTNWLHREGEMAYFKELMEVHPNFIRFIENKSHRGTLIVVFEVPRKYQKYTIAMERGKVTPKMDKEIDRLIERFRRVRSLRALRLSRTKVLN